MEFYLCRHGQTEANFKEIMSGWVDTPLTSKGVSDARNVAHRLLNVVNDFDRIYSSDLGRSYRTASIISAEGFDLFPTAVRELREMNYGVWNYRKRSDVIASNDFYNVDFVFEEGESFRSFQLRIISFIQSRIPFNEKILLVTHSGVIRAVNDHYGQHIIYDGSKRRLGHDYLGRYVVNYKNELVSYAEIN